MGGCPARNGRGYSGKCLKVGGASSQIIRNVSTQTPTEAIHHHNLFKSLLAIFDRSIIDHIFALSEIDFLLISQSGRAVADCRSPFPEPVCECGLLRRG